jgi:stage V sporulation protein AA
VVNVGETETLVEYSPEKNKPNAAVKWLKVVFVAVVLFVGSSTAIMAFQTDSELPKIFRRYNEIFLGVSTQNPYWVNIPFSIGLAVGIIVFFNHFAGRKLTNDPTPIEVRMKVYEDEVTTTKTAALEAMKERNEDVENP